VAVVDKLVREIDLYYSRLFADMDCHERIITFSTILSSASVNSFARGEAERHATQLLICQRLTSLLEVCCSVVSDSLQCIVNISLLLSRWKYLWCYVIYSLSLADDSFFCKSLTMFWSRWRTMPSALVMLFLWLC